MDQTFHFIGIGGIGMSALARILLQKGCKVQGSDQHPSQILDALTQEGARIWVGHSEEYVKEGSIIYNSAIDAANGELAKAKHLGLRVFHRSDLLHQLIGVQKPLLVTGTHGKTTTSSLLATVLMAANQDPSFALGGILHSCGLNGRKGEGEYFVVEADESDGSFLKTAAFGAIVTNCEEEHINYWGTFADLKKGFAEFFSNVASARHLFWCYDDPHLRSLAPKGFSYGFQEGADLQIKNYRILEDGISYDLSFQGKTYAKIECALQGRHQALNSSAVFGLCLTLGISPSVIYSALRAFQGVARRLEWKGEVRGVTCFDDYGHHPTEIVATLKALREKICERRLVVLFQPHRYSRLASLWDRFVDAFQEADLLFVTDVYSAGEEPLEGISGQSFAKASGGMYVGNASIVESLRPLDVFLTIGAGSVTQMGPPILAEYGKRGARYKVGIAYGGDSPEHAVSILSAKGISSALDPSLYEVSDFFVGKEGVWTEAMLLRLRLCDVVFPVFHGPRGEDGMIQGFLSTLQIPYVGSDYRASPLCMHKGWTKQIVVGEGIATAPWIQVRKNEREGALAKAKEKLRWPLWVKAIHLGSSVGVSRAENEEELIRALDSAFLVDDHCIVEEEIVGDEIEFAVLGNDRILVAEPCRILTDGQFYDYEKKYGSSAVKVEVPATLSMSQKEEGKALAKTVYEALGCGGIARVDFFLDRDGKFWLNEVNPFPGFTVNSGYPKMWEASGLEMKNLVGCMISLALARFRQKGLR